MHFFVSIFHTVAQGAIYRLFFMVFLQDLNCLIGRYLTPLQKETFLTQDEVCQMLPMCLYGLRAFKCQYC